MPFIILYIYIYYTIETYACINIICIYIYIIYTTYIYIIYTTYTHIYIYKYTVHRNIESVFRTMLLLWDWVQHFQLSKSWMYKSLDDAQAVGMGTWSLITYLTPRAWCRDSKISSSKLRGFTCMIWILIKWDDEIYWIPFRAFWQWHLYPRSLRLTVAVWHDIWWNGETCIHTSPQDVLTKHPDWRPKRWKWRKGRDDWGGGFSGRWVVMWAVVDGIYCIIPV